MKPMNTNADTGHVLDNVPFQPLKISLIYFMYKEVVLYQFSTCLSFFIKHLKHI